MTEGGSTGEGMKRMWQLVTSFFKKVLSFSDCEERTTSYILFLFVFNDSNIAQGYFG